MTKVELLLEVVRAYFFQKDYEGLQWESIKSKYGTSSSQCMNNMMDCLMMSACSLEKGEQTLKIASGKVLRFVHQIVYRNQISGFKNLGFDVLALNLGYKISGDTSKEGRFYFEFVYLWQKIAKRIRY